MTLTGILRLCVPIGENTAVLVSCSQPARIAYTIVDVKCPLFYDMLLNEQEQQFMQSSLYSYLPIEGELRDQFGAEYVRHSMNNTGDRWLICWDDRIVSLRASWELTEEQIDIIVEQLKP